MFDALRELWNVYLPDNNLLLLVRMMTGSANLLLIVFLWWSFISPAQIEPTWTIKDFRVNRVILFFKAFFGTMILIYFVSAGVFEVSRAGTPLKLIFANLGFTGMFFFSALEEIQWKVHYWRKKYIYKARNTQVLIQRGNK